MSLPPNISSPTVPAALDAFALERVPKAARAHTPQGAEAFARFYLEQVNRAWVDADPEQIRPYALASCKTCTNFVHTAEWLRDQHLRYDGEPGTLKASTWMPSPTQHRVRVRIVHVQEPRNIVRDDGTVEEHLQRLSGESELDVRWSSTCWSIAGVRGVK